MARILLLLVFTLYGIVASAQNRPCIYRAETLQFDGSPIEQARCLLRRNSIGGVLEKDAERLPKPLEKLIGQKVKISSKKLQEFLDHSGIKAADLGGNLDEPLATSISPAGARISSLYFVIHDTSWPYLGELPFPAAADTDPKWNGNDLSIWRRSPVAHVFVDRLGRSITTSPFSETVGKGWGTKFARDNLKDPGKAMQIHIELIQPRRRDAVTGSPTNDRIAPTPGFTVRQYERLALLYICASVRRGTWMIPAYHAAVDAGIKDAHDDPQNFDLAAFSNALRSLNEKLK